MRDTRRRIPIGLLLGLLGLAACSRPVRVEFAFWNVENLFDARDDPSNPGDDEYLPDGGWDEARYGRKLDHLARKIAWIDPHVIGFAEVENRAVLEDLFAQPALARKRYRVAHIDSPDGRGIDVALAFRAPLSLREAVALRGGNPVQLHPIDVEGRNPTRGVLEVQLEIDGWPLFVLVNHWPSRGGDRDGSYRRAAAAVARTVVDRIVAEEAAAGREADVLLVGDLNDEPFDPSVHETLGAVRSRNAVVNRRDVRHLYNPSWALLGEADLGTYYYNRDWVWNVLDQAIVSRGMLDDRGFSFVDGSLQVLAQADMRDQYRRPRWFRRGRGGEWAEGYSDHFPIHGSLRFGQAER